jgi:membrane-bound metal-dependent hydrolase YbcI (DUF457 family)
MKGDLPSFFVVVVLRVIVVRIVKKKNFSFSFIFFAESCHSLYGAAKEGELMWWWWTISRRRNRRECFSQTSTGRGE